MNSLKLTGESANERAGDEPSKRFWQRLSGKLEAEGKGPAGARGLKREQLQMDADDHTCPLCVNDFDDFEKQQLPCPCRYQVSGFFAARPFFAPLTRYPIPHAQICMFCYDRIKSESNKCPNCRAPYSDAPTRQSLAQYNAARAAALRDSKRAAAARPAAAPPPPPPGAAAAAPRGTPPPGARVEEVIWRRVEELRKTYVLQRTLVHVQGLPPGMREDKLKSRACFGQYGTILKFNLPPPPPGAPDASCFVVYERMCDAVAAIFAVDGFVLAGHALRAQFGTSKYCIDWLERGGGARPCSNPQCAFLHAIAHEGDVVYKNHSDPRGGGAARQVALVSPNMRHPSASGALGGRPLAIAAGPFAAAAAKAAAEAGAILPPTSFPAGIGETVAAVVLALTRELEVRASGGSGIRGGGGGTSSLLPPPPPPASEHARERERGAAARLPRATLEFDAKFDADSPLLLPGGGDASLGGLASSSDLQPLGGGMSPAATLSTYALPTALGSLSGWGGGGGGGGGGGALFAFEEAPQKALQPFPEEFSSLLASLEALRARAARRGAGALNVALLNTVAQQLEQQRAFFQPS